MFGGFFDGFTNAMPYFAQSDYWLAFSAGLIMATITALVPGVSSLMLMAMVIPLILIHVDDPIIGLVMLAVITGVNDTLDSLPAIVLGMPTATTQVTFLEGHQLARQGKAARTLGAVYVVEAIGGVTGAIVLLIAIPVMRPFILSIGFPEVTAISFFGLALISVLSHGAIQKGILAALFGLLIGTIGLSPIGGVPRFVFGELNLWSGLPLITVALGLFTLPEMVDLLMTRQPVAAKGANISTRETFAGAMDGLRRWKVAIRQSMFGVLMGAIPGVGGAVIDWLAYSFGILFTKDRSQFGKGSLDGLLFAESAQNAKEGGAAIPTLTLGVPGTGVWAIVLVALLSYGITPGPQMVDQYAHLTVIIVITLALGNVCLTMLGLVSSTYLAKLTLIPYPAIAAVVIPLSLVAGFLAATNWVAIPIAFSLGIIGFLMKKYAWPRPPLFIGFILGPIIEKNLNDAVNVHTFVGLLTRPLTMGLTVLAVIMAMVFHYLMSKSAMQISEIEAAAAADDAIAAGETPTAPSGAAPDAGSWSARIADAPHQLVSRWVEHTLPLFLTGLAIYFYIETRGMGARAGDYPKWLSLIVIGVAFTLFLRQVLTPRKERVEIMDLGVLSAGMAGARQAGWIIAGLFGLFSLVSVTISFQAGAVAFAFATPLPFMKRKTALITSAIAGSLMIAFIWGLVENLMLPIWPQVPLREFLGI
jgi:putative tricarboxylic transport membrane protein